MICCPYSSIFFNIYIIHLIGNHFYSTSVRTFFKLKSTRSLKPILAKAHSPPQESRGQDENTCGEYGGCVRYVHSENCFATVAQGPLISFATSKTVSPLAMWRKVSATPARSGTHQWESTKKIQVIHEPGNRLNGGQCKNKIGGEHLHHVGIAMHAW